MNGGSVDLPGVENKTKLWSCMQDAAVIGSELIGRPIDAKTLAIVDDKDKDLSVGPEHIHFALRELAGIDEHPFSEKFPLVIPQPDRLERLLG